MNEPSWMQIARKYEGTAEIRGVRDDTDIVAFLASTNLPPSMLHDETAWCSAFVNFCLEQAGLKGTDSASAASWLHWGEEIEEGKPGAVVMISRQGGSGFHVGFYVSENDFGVTVLGGNQSDSVCEKTFPWEIVEYFRMPKEA